MSDYDVVVVGSGFGGAVSALRLAEKGYRVHVFESGRRFADHEFAATSWDLRRYLWAPRLKCFGVQRVHRLPDVVILAGAGVGGGSLNYANTLYVPPAPFFRDPQWGNITDWRAELAPHYERVRHMLAVGDRSPYARRHAVEALNFNLSWLLYIVISGILIFVLVGFVLLPLLAIGYLVFVILGAVAASRGEEYRYPMTIRLVH